MFYLYFNLLLLVLLTCIFLYCKLTCGICKCSKHLVGKVVIVTGGNTGIGYETAKNLAERGARVVLAGVNPELGNIARHKIINASGNSDVHYYHLDLSSFASIRRFTEVVIKKEKRLDILINNAGIFQTNLIKTEDGLCRSMQTNYFGPFLLTSLLLPLLKSSAPSRIINVASTAYKFGTIDFTNLQMEKETINTFSYFKAYSTAKLCSVLMTVELGRILKGTRVTANSLHPGMINTEMVAMFKSAGGKLTKLFVKLLLKSPWEGSQTTVYLAVSRDVENISGQYFTDCRMQKISKKAQDKKLAHQLWQVSEEILKLV